MFDADTIHRTVLLSAHDHAHATLEGAAAAHAATGITIVCDSATCTTLGGQAALLTAVATAARAFGQVDVVVPANPPDVIGGPTRGQPLADAIHAEGAVMTTPGFVMNPSWPVLLIGGTDTGDVSSVKAPVLRATWNGWNATVAPAATAATDTDEHCVLAALAAGALGVHEAFESVRAKPGSDAGYRTATINLWAPGQGADDEAPALRHAPAAWWLLGLGHLGQAYAWAISWLPYDAPSDVTVMLQDVDTTTPSTHSTGILTPEGSVDEYKTDVLKRAMRGAGFTANVIERRFHGDLRVQPDEVHVALIGVDNLPTRRLISTAGWRLAIDVGLGATPAEYAALTIRRFPGYATSDAVTAWNTEVQPVTVPSSPAFSDLQSRDACGATTLAGKAVGACFVGVIAAAHALAEAVRGSHRGDAHDVVTFDVGTLMARSSGPVDAFGIVSCRLGRPSG
ncbi:MAG: hypothetical protein QOK28_3382 [Actinomycetota bacterium]|jgi:hypothetical protein